MLKDNKHIDSLFADGLKNLSVPPNPKVWQGINSKMMAAKKKRLFAIYMWTGVAASILLLLVIGNHYFTGQPNYNMQLNTLSENITVVQKDSEQELKLQIDPKADAITEGEYTGNSISSDKLFSSENKQGDGSKSVNQVANTQHADETESKEIRIKETTGKSAGMFDGSNGSEIRTSNSDLVFSSKEKELAFLDREFVNALMNSKSEEKLSNFEYKLPTQLVPNTSQLNKEQDFSLMADEIQIQKNILSIEKLSHEKNRENRWSVIGQISSSYSSYLGDSKGNNIESGIWSVGGGAKVSFAMNKKFAFQTGIVYNRFGQDLSSGGGRDLMSHEVNLIPEDKTIHREVSYPSVTSAGAIRLSGGSRLPMADPSPFTGEFTSSNSYSSSADLIQSFKSIEIPFLMRYNLLQKRVGVFVSGGLSANIIVGNGVYDQSKGNKKIGEIEGIRTTNFSSQFSFGLEYRLNSKFQIGLEPSFKYYLNSINTSSQYKYKPYSIGIFTGIRYDF